MDWSHIRLSRGQLAWVLSHGDQSSPRMVSRLKHLRALGIPNSGKSGGPGNRVQLTLEEAMEVAIASELIDRGMKPKVASDLLIDGRDRVIRPSIRLALDEITPVQLKQEWIFSKGRSRAFMADEIVLNIGGGYLQPSTDSGADFIKFGGERSQVMLRRLATEIAGLALSAPETRPGPQ